MSRQRGKPVHVNAAEERLQARRKYLSKGDSVKRSQSDFIATTANYINVIGQAKSERI